MWGFDSPQRSGSAHPVLVDFLDQRGALQLQQLGSLGHIALGPLQGLLNQATFNIHQMV